MDNRNLRFGERSSEHGFSAWAGSPSLAHTRAEIQHVRSSDGTRRQAPPKPSRDRTPVAPPFASDAGSGRVVAHVLARASASNRRTASPGPREHPWPPLPPAIHPTSRRMTPATDSPTSSWPPAPPEHHLVPRNLASPCVPRTNIRSRQLVPPGCPNQGRQTSRPDQDGA